MQLERGYYPFLYGCKKALASGHTGPPAKSLFYSIEPKILS